MSYYEPATRGIADNDLIAVVQDGTHLVYMTGLQFKTYCGGGGGGSGTPGVGIQSSAVTYQASASGTAVPTGTWTSSVPAVSAGQFLWTRTILTMTDASTATAYSIGYVGTDGNTILTTSGAPSNSVGKDGNYAYDPSAAVMYGPKASGVWPAGVSFIPATSNVWFKQSGISVTHNASEGLSTTFNLLSLVIPANTMDVQGLLEFLPALTMGDTSNPKTITIAIGGVTLWTYNGSGSTSFDSYIQIQNANSKTANMVRASNNNAPFQTGIIAMQQTAIDFTQDQTLTITCSFTAGTSATLVTLNHWHVRVWNQ
ncbi:hypothetical protein [Caballeronia sp. AZ10_KS36]|uniref:hypothetical protein n=1 Tax=Caballeronia sp. AZ10_KS36 TaxID=2921757 RepID=UPI002027A34E|nr:hypothetical protein [Caballeronia sp. AZ10_KS36]